MPDKYYDVIVIGRSLGALATAALLARRDFTVLLLGQGRPAANYHYEDRQLRRRAFTMLAAASPAWWRILAELAHTQTWNRRVQPVVPMLQLMLPGKRFEVPPDSALFRREVEREFPHERRLISALYDDFARVAAAADGAFDHDAVWPPGGFFERRETNRIAATLPYARGEPHADLLADFPRDHPYRRIVMETVRFSSDLGSRPPAFAVARLHGSWTRGMVALPGGEQELNDMLVQRIESNGGVCRMHERAARITVRRGSVSGVHIDGDPRPMGAGFVVADLNGEEIASLTDGGGISKKAQREWPRVSAVRGRYVASLVVRREGVPDALGDEAFIFSDRSEIPDATIHLQRSDSGQPDEVLLVAEMLRSARDPIELRDARGWIVKRLCRALPFLERHLLLADSVHDGLPLWRYTPAEQVQPPVEIARMDLAGAGTRVEPMEPQIEVDPPGYLGLGGEPLRGPVGRSLLVGRSVLPALGQEGQLLAAAAAARVVTSSDNRKARMRREMWTKIEIS